jgi:anhydro-N-acetylmuramic acid kinase
MTDELIIGMLSGTSRDGVDAVLVNFSDGSMEILHALCAPYPAAIKLTLEQLLETGQPPTREVAQLLDENLAYFFARVAQDLVRETGLEMRDVRAIGSHGQNVWHQPWGDKPVTMQLGRGDLIVRNTSTTVVNNFRVADVKAGGQGAPLAPLLHQQLFRSETENRAVLNLGGIANLTILPVTGVVTGFDCGPGNCLMDGWTKAHLQKDYDSNGRWAAKGEIDNGLLSRMLEDPYFRLPTPKSTGLEHFNMPWLEQILGQTPPAAINVQATLAELTAQSIARSLAAADLPKRLLVCGGGTHNSFLMQRIAAALPDVVVEPTALHGTDPDWVEGLLFAWLARERLSDRKQDTTCITGANQAVLLGEIHQSPAA